MWEGELGLKMGWEQRNLMASGSRLIILGLFFTETEPELQQTSPHLKRTTIRVDTPQRSHYDHCNHHRLCHSPDQRGGHLSVGLLAVVAVAAAAVAVDYAAAFAAAAAAPAAATGAAILAAALHQLRAPTAILAAPLHQLRAPLSALGASLLAFQLRAARTVHGPVLLTPRGALPQQALGVARLRDAAAAVGVFVAPAAAVCCCGFCFGFGCPALAAAAVVSSWTLD